MRLVLVGGSPWVVTVTLARIFHAPHQSLGQGLFAHRPCSMRPSYMVHQFIRRGICVHIYVYNCVAIDSLEKERFIYGFIHCMSAYYIISEKSFMNNILWANLISDYNLIRRHRSQSNTTIHSEIFGYDLMPKCWIALYIVICILCYNHATIKYIFIWVIQYNTR